MAEAYITQNHTWVTGQVLTAARLNGNVSNIIDGLDGGVKAINVGKLLVNSLSVIDNNRKGELTDLDILDASNDGNPLLAIGATTSEILNIQSVYDTGAQTLDYALFQTKASSATADKGKFMFEVDESQILEINDSGISVTGGLTASTGLTIGSDITSTGAAIDWDLIDNNASALSFDAAGKAGILALVTTDSGEGVTMSGTLGVTGVATFTAQTVHTNGWSDGTASLDGSGAIAGVTNLTISGTFTDGTASLVGGAFTGLTNITVDNLNANGNTISSTSGAINLTPVAGSALIIDSHWSFDGVALTALTDANTAITAYAGKNIAIEGVTFDGGVVAGIGSLTVDNLLVDGNTISANTGAINLIPATGSAIVLDSTINIDAGVVTGATSITSTSFVGALTGNADTATTLQTARTIGGVSFNGSANITVASATGGFAVSGGNLTLDSNDILVNTNKFTVDGATGNTLVAGTLDVTGTATAGTLTDGTASLTSGALSGVTTISNSGGITTDATSANIRHIIRTTGSGNYYADLTIATDDSDIFIRAFDDGYTTTPEFTGKSVIWGSGGNMCLISQTNNLDFYVGGFSSSEIRMTIDTAGIVSMPQVYSHDMTGETIRPLMINSSGELGYQDMYYTVGANVLANIRTGWSQSVGSSFSFSTTASNSDAYFSVHLPNGSVVTEFKAELYGDGTNAVTATLYRHAWNDTLRGNASAMATVSRTTASYGTETDSSITNATIDNDTYRYYVALTCGTNAGTMAFKAFKIKYQ